MHGILPKEDPEAAEIVRQSLLRDGLTILCCGKDLRGGKDADGKRLAVDSHSEHYDLAVDEILVAGGRAPNVEGTGLEAAGVEFDKKGVKVNDRLQTTNPRIYAAGDVCSKYQFTHAADALARIVLQNALFPERARASALIMPWCTYTDPEVAHVGLYEKEAQEQSIPVQTFVQSLADVDRAVLDGATGGFVKVHVRAGTDRIVGATVVARHAGEMISELTLAMVGRLGLKTLARTIHPYPTQAEAIKKIADAYSRTRLRPWIKRIMDRWFAWTR
jgi:pyruvate/2-oxoglutarate dehydrogenase complex dihydrolipoamide dehydrogenase (E3) component